MMLPDNPNWQMTVFLLLALALMASPQLHLLAESWHFSLLLT
jgi:hypothetical protein